MALTKIVTQCHSGGGAASFVIDAVQETILQVLKRLSLQGMSIYL